MRIVEEQQNNNLSVEILNGNAESLTGLVGSAQALKEPGVDHTLVCVVAKYTNCLYTGAIRYIHQQSVPLRVIRFFFPFLCPFQALLETRVCKD